MQKAPLGKWIPLKVIKPGLHPTKPVKVDLPSPRHRHNPVTDKKGVVNKKPVKNTNQAKPPSNNVGGLKYQWDVPFHPIQPTPKSPSPPSKSTWDRFIEWVESNDAKVYDGGIIIGHKIERNSEAAQKWVSDKIDSLSDWLKEQDRKMKESKEPIKKEVTKDHGTIFTGGQSSLGQRENKIGLPDDIVDISRLMTLLTAHAGNSAPSAIDKASAIDKFTERAIDIDENTYKSDTFVMLTPEMEKALFYARLKTAAFPIFEFFIELPQEDTNKYENPYSKRKYIK